MYLQANQDTAANTKADAAPNLSKTPSTRGRPERRKTKRAPFLRRRGEYSMTGNSSAIVDGMVSQGMGRIIYRHVRGFMFNVICMLGAKVI